MSQEHYYAVALVVDRAFGDQLLEFVRRLHVWIVDSPGNRAAVKEAWSELVPRHSLDEGRPSLTTMERELPMRSRLLDWTISSFTTVVSAIHLL
jgi:hypothetical protein